MVCHRMGDNQPSPKSIPKFPKFSPLKFPKNEKFQQSPNFPKLPKVRPYVLDKCCPLVLASLEILEILECLENFGNFVGTALIYTRVLYSTFISWPPARFIAPGSASLLEPVGRHSRAKH